MAPARWTSFNFIVILGNSGFAGRPVQFDSSGNGPIRERVVRAVFPHPGPLPQGEGTARIAQWKAEVSGLFSVRRKVHPLPEGWSCSITFCLDPAGHLVIVGGGFISGRDC